jgi:hypothetical protein
MALPRALIRILAFAAALLGVVLLYNLAFTPSPEGVWDASSWADRRSKNSPYQTEDNPNGVVYDHPDPNLDTQGSRWSLFGGSKGGVKKDAAPRPGLSDPRPLPRVNTTRARENFGKSRIVIPNTSPEEYTESPLPTLDEAFAHLEPMMRAVKEKHQNIPREHDLWQPIFPPFLTDDLQERFWHLREEWDEETKSWKHSGDRRFMLVTVCKQVAGESSCFAECAGWELICRYVGGLVRYLDSVGGFLGPGDATLFAARGRFCGWQVSCNTMGVGQSLPYPSLSPVDYASSTDPPLCLLRTISSFRKPYPSPIYDSLTSGEIFAEVMRDYLLFLGVPPKNINIQTHLPKVDWEQHHRIELLASMRNDGMKPLYDTAPSGLTYDGKPWSAVVFYNDVYLSGTHFLELLHQHFMQDADMTCGWDHAGRWFYDGWVGRDMSGDLYTPFPVKEEDKDLPQKVSPRHHEPAQ